MVSWIILFKRRGGLFGHDGHTITQKLVSAGACFPSWFPEAPWLADTYDRSWTVSCKGLAKRWEDSIMCNGRTYGENSPGLGPSVIKTMEAMSRREWTPLLFAGPPGPILTVCGLSRLTLHAVQLWQVAILEDESKGDKEIRGKRLPLSKFHLYTAHGLYITSITVNPVKKKLGLVWVRNPKEGILFSFWYG